MTKPLKAKVLALVAVLVVVFASACSVPRRTLSFEEKKADLYWLFSIFNENYAPLEYKEARFKFNYEALKEKYIEDAKNTKSNDEFYDLMFRFVSEFKDAHTSASLTNSSLPGRTKIAYLGFFGVRVKDSLIVNEFLPTIQRGYGFPIRFGEKITKLDGVPLVDIVRNEMVQFRNLGQDEANLTYHMDNIFTRVSTVNGQPKKDTATLTVLRNGKEEQITLPWIIKDVVQFSTEQREAAVKVGDDYRNEENNTNAFYSLGFMALQKAGTGEINFMPSFIQKITRNVKGFSFWDTFEFVDTIPSMKSTSLRRAIAEAAQLLNLVPNKDALLRGASPMAYLRKQRSVPWNVFALEESRTYPAYVSYEDVMDAEGNSTGQKKFVAYMYLDTFSPNAPEPIVLMEVANTLQKLQSLGVQDIIIDMINNGGGSLSLGMKLAQLFSNEKVAMPDMQFKLSETWLDEFEEQSLRGFTDLDRELARRTYVLLKSEKDGGKKISSRLSAESLLPYELVPNAALNAKFNVVLLVNEMCASMCDIFTGIMKDNKLATVVGSRTMGAGGNVVEHMFAPNTGMTVRQTESLIVTSSGAYIENNGIEPDVAVNVNAYTMSRYSAVVRQAMNLLTTQPKKAVVTAEASTKEAATQEASAKTDVPKL